MNKLEVGSIGVAENKVSTQVLLDQPKGSQRFNVKDRIAVVGLLTVVGLAGGLLLAAPIYAIHPDLYFSSVVALTGVGLSAGIYKGIKG